MWPHPPVQSEEVLNAGMAMPLGMPVAHDRGRSSLQPFEKRRRDKRPVRDEGNQAAEQEDAEDGELKIVTAGDGAIPGPEVFCRRHDQAQPGDEKEDEPAGEQPVLPGRRRR